MKTRDIARKIDSEITATGMDALTVRPTLSTRKSDDAPKTMPSSVPTMTARQVNSWRWVVSGAMNGSMAGTAVAEGGGVLDMVGGVAEATLRRR